MALIPGDISEDDADDGAGDDSDLRDQISDLKDQIGQLHDFIRNIQDTLHDRRLFEDETRRRIEDDEETSAGATCGRDSPTTLGDATEGAEAASTLSWSSALGTPLDIWETTRVGYFEAGDETLYGYKRKFSYDACGKLYAVSAEVRYTVEVPVICTDP